MDMLLAVTVLFQLLPGAVHFEHMDAHMRVCM